MRASLFVLLLLGVALAQGANKPVRIRALVDLGNKKCPIEDKDVDPQAVVDWNGVRVHLCCNDCKAAFEKAPAVALKKLGCDVVQIGKIGTFVDLMNKSCPLMGKAAAPNFTTDIDGVRVHYCCAKCPAKAAKDLENVYKTLGYAYIPSVVDVRNSTCPMSGKPVDPAVFADKQGIRVHFCCGDCAGEFQKDPAATFAKMGIDPAKLKASVK